MRIYEALGVKGSEELNAGGFDAKKLGS